MIAPPKVPDTAEVQRLIPYGYMLNCCRHFVLQVTQSVEARRFIGELVARPIIGKLVAQPIITTASVHTEDVKKLKEERRCPVNIGFTFRGLEKLELGVPYLRVFEEKAKAFVEGASARAARRLADSGPSASPCWDEQFEPDHAHVLLSAHADTQEELEQFSEKLRWKPGADGLDGWDHPLDGRHLTTVDGCPLPENRDVRIEHFGFRDGISNPVIEGFPPHRNKAHAPGEFLLGYWNDEKFNPWLLVNPWPKPNPWLLPLNPAPKLTEFFRNGSFGALRKLEQDVGGFRASVERWAIQLGGGQDPEKWREYVRAKLSGRWWNGAVVKPGQNDPPDRPRGYPPASELCGHLLSPKLNDFDFSEDPHAHGCPFGAHIRRMNPRSDPVAPSRKRPLIRRGMPYGPEFDRDPGEPRGLLGLYFCASLEDQFEHLLSEWGNANPMGPDNRGDSKDPLVGNHQGPRAFFDIPMPGEPLRQLDGFNRYVTTRGTLYAFFPSLGTIGRIARCGAPAP
jgi:deferrochelatase/peroxidase EfeB